MRRVEITRNIPKYMKHKNGIFIGWFHLYETGGNTVKAIIESHDGMICLVNVDDIRFLDPPEEENKTFGNTELLKEEKLRLDNAHAKICNLKTEIGTLTERVEKLESVVYEPGTGYIAGITPTMQGEPERVVENTDIPPRIWTREEINTAFTKWVIHLSEYCETKDIHLYDFLSELDKIKEVKE